MLIDGRKATAVPVMDIRTRSISIPAWRTAYALLLLVTTAAAQPETFRLQSTKSEKVFGPFDFFHGATVTIGRVQFEILRDAKPEPPPIVVEGPEFPPPAEQYLHIHASISYLARRQRVAPLVHMHVRSNPQRLCIGILLD